MNAYLEECYLNWARRTPASERAMGWMPSNEEIIEAGRRRLREIETTLSEIRIPVSGPTANYLLLFRWEKGQWVIDEDDFE